jgi:hypothetical protein
MDRYRWCAPTLTMMMMMLLLTNTSDCIYSLVYMQRFVRCPLSVAVFGLVLEKETPQQSSAHRMRQQMCVQR